MVVGFGPGVSSGVASKAEAALTATKPRLRSVVFIFVAASFYAVLTDCFAMVRFHLTRVVFASSLILDAFRLSVAP